MAGFSPENMERVYPEGMGDMHVFSNGQEPPQLARVWFEGSSLPSESSDGPLSLEAEFQIDEPEEDSLPPGYEVRVRAEGPYSAEFIGYLAMYEQDEDYADEVLAAKTAQRPINLTAELPTDPRFHGEPAAEHAALGMALNIFWQAERQ